MSAEYDYFVAELDRKNLEIDFSRTECESSLAAGMTLRMLEELEPEKRFMIVAVPTGNVDPAPHICRQCNCQFDYRGHITH